MDFIDGALTLRIQTDNSETHEKAVLIAGNIWGVREVNLDARKIPGGGGDAEYFSFQSGDSPTA